MLLYCICLVLKDLKRCSKGHRAAGRQPERTIFNAKRFVGRQLGQARFRALSFAKSMASPARRMAGIAGEGRPCVPSSLADDDDDDDDSYAAGEGGAGGGRGGCEVAAATAPASLDDNSSIALVGLPGQAQRKTQ